MSRVGLALALAGFGIACWVVWQQDVEAVGGLLASAGLVGLILTALSHLPAMVLNAQAWAMLMPGHGRPALPGMVFQVWIREAVNALLPVAHLGGAVVAARLLHRRGFRLASVAAGSIGDITMEVLTQILFTFIGLGLLMLLVGESGIAGYVLGGTAITLLASAAFMAVQWFGMTAVLERGIMRLSQRFGCYANSTRARNF